MRVHCCRVWRDHPRGCGEHLIGLRQPGKRTGSSPRMRGALIEQTDYELEQRIIPADAGSTPASLGPLSLGEDHPRGCGEH